MNWGRVCCIFGVHDWGRFYRLPFKLIPQPTPLKGDDYSDGLQHWQWAKERKCKRCGTKQMRETKPLKPRRAPTSADTIQGPQ